MVLTSRATCCGRSALRLVLSVCWSPRHDAFSLRAEVSIRSAALAAFQLQEEDLSSDLVLSVAAAAAGLVTRNNQLTKMPLKQIDEMYLMK